MKENKVQYFCKKSFYMSSGEIAFKKGFIYEGTVSFDNHVSFVSEHNGIHLMSKDHCKGILVKVKGYKGGNE